MRQRVDLNGYLMKIGVLARRRACTKWQKISSLEKLKQAAEGGKCSILLLLPDILQTKAMSDICDFISRSHWKQNSASTYRARALDNFVTHLLQRITSAIYYVELWIINVGGNTLKVLPTSRLLDPVGSSQELFRPAT